jgi:hypothetical protein
MVEGRFDLIDGFIGNSERTMIVIIDCINNLCDPNANLKNIAE